MMRYLRRAVLRFRLLVSGPSLLDDAYKEGRDVALDNAAMKALDMGHPKVCSAINALVPEKDSHRGARQRRLVRVTQHAGGNA